MFAFQSFAGESSLEDLREKLLIAAESEANENNLDDLESNENGIPSEMLALSNSSSKAVIYSYISVFLADMNYSLLIPFFPKFAMERGLVTGTIGILFAVFHLVGFLTSSKARKMNEKFRGSRILIIFTFLQSFVTALMSFTGLLNDSVAFFVVCLLLRILQGFFASIIEITSGRLAMQSASPQKVQETLSRLEGCRTLGTMIGPLLGGGLYKLIGYSGPFIASSSLLATIATCMTFFPVEIIEGAFVTNDCDTLRTYEMKKRLLKSPIIVIILLSVYILIVGITFIEPTLQPFVSLKPYYLNELEIGVLFSFYLLLLGISAAGSTVIVKSLGYMSSLFVGSFMMSSAYIISVPPEHKTGALSLFSFLHQSSKHGAIGILLGGLSLLGIGGGLCFIPVNLVMVNEGEYLGYSILETSDAISGLLNTSFTLGAAIGPFISGVISSFWGFSNSCALMGYIIIIFEVTMLISFSCIHYIRIFYNQHEDQSEFTTTGTPLVKT